MDVWLLAILSRDLIPLSSSNDVGGGNLSNLPEGDYLHYTQGPTQTTHTPSIISITFFASCNFFFEILSKTCLNYKVMIVHIIIPSIFQLSNSHTHTHHHTPFAFFAIYYTYNRKNSSLFLCAAPRLCNNNNQPNKRKTTEKQDIYSISWK